MKKLRPWHDLRWMLVLIVPVALVLFTLSYWLGMNWVEQSPRTMSESLQWATETLTTTGYGRDARWTHPVMIAFVVIAQISGVVAVFLVLPIFFIPILERRFQLRVPREVEGLSGHVVVYRWGSAVSDFVEELSARGTDVVLIEEEEAAARRHLDQGRRAVVGTFEEGVLDKVCLEQSHFLVANGADGQNADLVIRVRQRGWQGSVAVLVNHPHHRQPLSLAGADVVLTPRHALAAAVAARVSERLEPSRLHLRRVGGGLDVQEVRVDADSSLAGQTLGSLDLGRRSGATVLGQWIRGSLEAPATAETVVEAGSILVVAGSVESQIRVRELARGVVPLAQSGTILVAGHGETGQTVAAILRDSGETVLTVDSDPARGADLVLDVLDPMLLQDAQISNCRAVVLALGSDSSASLAALVVRDWQPNALVVAGLKEIESVPQVRFAGADMALSLSQVTADLLLQRLLGEKRQTISGELQVLELDAGALAGRRLDEIELRKRSGASVVAVERREHLEVELDPGYRLHDGDVLFICGDNQALERCRQFVSGLS